MMDIPISALGELGESLGEGGQATIMALSDRNYVFKRYHTSEQPSDPSLRSVIAWRESISEVRRGYLDAHASWPRARVLDDRGVTLGVLLPRIPDHFFIQLFGPGGAKRKPGELQYLMYPEQSTKLGLVLPDVSGRILLCRQWLTMFELFEHHDVVFGDVSMRNLLWRSHDAHHAAYVIDCDTAQAGGPFRPSPFTQDWDDPQLPSGAPADAASDRYKLALVVYRALWLTKKRPTTVHDVESSLPVGAPPDVVGLIMAGVSPDRVARPPASDYLKVLGRDDPLVSMQSQDWPLLPTQNPTPERRDRPVHRLPKAPDDRGSHQATATTSGASSVNAPPSRHRKTHRLDEVSRPSLPTPTAVTPPPLPPPATPSTPPSNQSSPTTSWSTGSVIVAVILAAMLFYYLFGK